MPSLSGGGASAGPEESGKGTVLFSTLKPQSTPVATTPAAAAAAPSLVPAGAAGGGAAAAPPASFVTVTPASQLADEYVKLLDAVGTPNYETIQSLFAGYGCPPSDTIPAIHVSFELFEAVQNRFAATKQVLERTKADLLSRNQQYANVLQDLHRVREEYEVLRKRNSEAEVRNTELHQQRAKLEVSVEQLRREVGQGRTALDTLRNKLARREEELQVSQSRVAENLVALSQKDAVVNTLRRELLKRGSQRYGAAYGVMGDANGAERDMKDGEDTGKGDGSAVQASYAADVLESIAADVEGRAQEARMKLNVAELEVRLSRLQEEKDSVLTQHTQYRQHVQLALQSYEAEAMLREDTMGRHVCVHTPYFSGEQQEMYEKVVNLQTGERLDKDTAPTSARGAARGRASETSRNSYHSPVDTSTADATLALSNFTGLSFEVREIVERFSKVHIDKDSCLYDDLSLCVEAQRRALQTGSSLVGILRSMEEEVMHRRFTLPEVREEWKKACVPEFVQTVAAALHESASELRKGLVGLLERENAFVAEIEGAKRKRTPSAIAADAAAAAAAASMRNSMIAKQKKRGQHGSSDASTPSVALGHVHAGVMARLSVPGRDVAVQVPISDVSRANAATNTAAMMTSPSDGGQGPFSSPVRVSSAGLWLLTSETPPPNQGVAGIPSGGASGQGEGDEERRSAMVQQSASLENLPWMPGAPQHLFNASTSSAGVGPDDGSTKSKESNHPLFLDRPVVLSGTCPYCRREITLSSVPSAAQRFMSPGDDGCIVPAVASTHASVVDATTASQMPASGIDVERAVNPDGTSVFRVSFSSSPGASAASQLVGTLPRVYSVSTSEGVEAAVQAAGDRRKVSTPAAGSVSAAPDERTSADAVGLGSRGSVSGDAEGETAQKGSKSSKSPSFAATTEMAAVELLQYQQRLRTTEQTLAEMQAANEMLRAQLAAALAAAHERWGVHSPATSAGTDGYDGGRGGDFADGASSAAGAVRDPQPGELFGHGEGLQQERPLVSPFDGSADCRNNSLLSSNRQMEGVRSLSIHSPTPTQGLDGEGADTTPIIATPAAVLSGASARNGAADATDETVYGADGGESGVTSDAADAGNHTSATKPKTAAAATRRAGKARAKASPAAVGALSEKEGGLHAGTAPQQAGHPSNDESTAAGGGSGAPPPPSNPRNAAAHTKHGSKRPYTPSPPALPRPKSPGMAATAPAAELRTKEDDNKQWQAIKSSSFPKALPQTHWEARAKHQHHSAPPSSHAVPAHRAGQLLRLSEREGGEDKGDGGAMAPFRLSHPTTLTGAAVGYRFKPPAPTSRRVLKPPIIGYAGDTIPNGGPSPFLSLDLIVTGSGGQPTTSTTTRWTAADRSLAAPFQLFHRNFNNMGSSSNTASNKSASSTRQAVSFLSFKCTGSHITPFSKEKQLSSHGEVRTQTAMQVPLAALSSSLPPVKRLPSTPPLPPSPVRTEPPGSAAPTAALSPAMQPPPPLPAIHAGDAHDHETASVAAPTTRSGSDSNSATPRRAITTALPSQGRHVSQGDGSLKTSSQDTNERQRQHHSSESCPSAVSPPSLHTTPAQGALRPLLSPVPTSPLIVSESRLPSHQVLQLAYQVLRIRSSTLGYRSGAAARQWQKQRAAAGRRFYSLGNGGAVTAKTISNQYSASGASTCIDAGFPALMTIPRGCVRRPLIIRRVRAQYFSSARRTANTEVSDRSRMLFSGADRSKPEGLHVSPPRDAHRTSNSSTEPLRPPTGQTTPPMQPVAYRYYLSTPAQVPRRWSTRWNSSHNLFEEGLWGGRERRFPRIPRTWQQQRRYERSLWLRQTSRDPAAVRELPLSGGSAPHPPPPRSAPGCLPAFTAEQLMQEHAEEQHYPPFLCSPLPLFPNSATPAAAGADNQDGGRASEVPLQPITSRIRVCQNLPRRPTRAALLRAKRDPVQRAVKRNVYTTASPTESLPSYSSD
ncbi:hypothetical protein ABL78_4935 [Leptomonas seymouri]|uniref:Uncharacterized protein n=1 Tax=Leptomonas seymouri TaxID=5684 RepID=A0A0N1I467_LEPSE|nr:hypothetical protein ABL78_4935 [Leptomonas seymouri]|eukprot:KPI86002.1 hypothetical protein ABL78_4935 [Leptomonas seymouri]